MASLLELLTHQMIICEALFKALKLPKPCKDFISALARIVLRGLVACHVATLPAWHCTIVQYIYGSEVLKFCVQERQKSQL